MSGDEVQGWDLSAHGQQHRVEITGSFSRTVTWRVDGQLVAATKSSEDTVRLRPGDRLGKSGSMTDADAEGQPDVGASGVKVTAFGRPRRVPWYRVDGGVSATTRALPGRGGIDLDP